jgi:hypothetical protein
MVHTAGVRQGGIFGSIGLEISATEPIRQDTKDIIDRVINEMGRVEKEVR